MSEPPPAEEGVYKAEATGHSSFIQPLEQKMFSLPFSIARILGFGGDSSTSSSTASNIQTPPASEDQSRQVDAATEGNQVCRNFSKLDVASQSRTPPSPRSEVNSRPVSPLPTSASQHRVPQESASGGQVSSHVPSIDDLSQSRTPSPSQSETSSHPGSSLSSHDAPLPPLPNPEHFYAAQLGERTDLENFHERVYADFHFQHLEELPSLSYLGQILEHFIFTAVANLGLGDAKVRVGATVSYPGIADFPVFFRPRHLMTGDYIMNEIQRGIQNNSKYKEIRIDATMKIRLCVVEYKEKAKR